MSTSPTDATKKAREALGLRLREIRKDAGLTGRAFASAAGWHFTRVSKLENGVQAPSDDDIRTWCATCSADALVPDLIAQARAVESMYLEFKRQTRAGMKQLMLAPVPLYERTNRFRNYEHHAIPGLLQTAGYMRAMLHFWFDFLDVHDDIDEAVRARLIRQDALYQPGKTFAFILEEAALYTWFGGPETMAGQLDRLLAATSLPNVSLGIVPRTTDRAVIGQTSFWIYDDTLVKLETATAAIEVTAPVEVGMYAKMFEHLARPAVYGKEARSLILAALDALADGGA